MNLDGLKEEKTLYPTFFYFKKENSSRGIIKFQHCFTLYVNLYT